MASAARQMIETATVSARPELQTPCVDLKRQLLLPNGQTFICRSEIQNGTKAANRILNQSPKKQRRQAMTAMQITAESVSDG